MSDNIESLSRLLDRCESGGAEDQMEILCAVGWLVGFGDRFNSLIDCGAYMDAAIEMLPKGAVWRKYTDECCSVYGASPYNAKAQVRFDGFNRVEPLAICAALLRMGLAPLLKEQAATKAREQA